MPVDLNVINPKKHEPLPILEGEEAGQQPIEGGVE